MRVYRFLWTLAAATVSALGCLMAVVVVQRSVLIVITLGVPVTAGILGRLPNCPRIGPIGALGLVVVLVGFCGLVTALGLAGFVLAVLLGGSAPPLLSWVRDQFPAQGRPKRRPVIPIEPPSGLGSLGIPFNGRRAARGSDAPPGSKGYSVAEEARPPDLGAVTHLMSSADLLHAWQLSYLALERAASATDVSAAAELRRTYLDELEERDPAGFAAWMLSGARAASNPSRYVKMDVDDLPDAH